MPNYYTKTKNPIARAGVIRGLMALGYIPFHNHTVSELFTAYPAKKWPVVLVRFDRKEQGKPVIDLGTNNCKLKDALYFSPVSLNLPPAFLESASYSPAFPESCKYKVDYTDAKGVNSEHIVSAPIDSTNDSITVYSYGRGVRTLKKARIRNFSKCN